MTFSDTSPLLVNNRFMPVPMVGTCVMALARKMRGSGRILILVSLWWVHAPLIANNGQDDEVKIDVEVARELYSRGVIFPLGYFIKLARQIHPGQPIDAYLYYEPSHGCYEYEVYLLDKSGVVWEVVFNAHTGAVIELEPESN
jgi:uncharacterized membrane protein YkoI